METVLQRGTFSTPRRRSWKSKAIIISGIHHALQDGHPKSLRPYLSSSLSAIKGALFHYMLFFTVKNYNYLTSEPFTPTRHPQFLCDMRCFFPFNTQKISKNYRSIAFPCSSVKISKESACSTGDPDSIPGLGRSPGIGNGNPQRLTFTFICQLDGAGNLPGALSQLQALPTQRYFP